MAIFNFPSPRHIIQIGVCALLVCHSLVVTDASPIPSSSSSTNTSATPSGQLLSVPDSDQTQFRLWVKYASAAYCNVDNWNCGAACEGPTTGTQLIKSLNTSVNDAYVAINDAQSAIIVAFRGSETLDSFATDSKFAFADFPGVPGAQVHQGFLEAFNSTRDEINSLVAEAIAKNPNYQVILTGHSLGGALAVLQLTDLVGSSGLTPENLITYTYGQPRIGNPQFAQFLEQKTEGYQIFRVVNRDDLVPHVPPVFLGYVHEGPEFWIVNNTMIECTVAEDPSCSDSVDPKDLNIIDHTNYLDTPFVLSCLVP